MTETHTPGPWSEISFGGRQIGNPETGEAVCTMWGSKGNAEDDANARLIAAAPDLLEALSDLLVHTSGINLPTTAHAMRSRAQAAIAKATGRD